MNSRIQRILVPLDVSEYAEAATLRACEIAREHHAQVTGLVILDSPGIASDLAPLEVSHWQTVRDAVTDAINDAEKRIEVALEQFASVCEAEGIPHSELEIEGVPAERILEHGMYFDLIVMGLRTFFHFETREGNDGHSMEKILDHTITPVLAVPKGRRTPLKKAVIAFDGTFNAGRALHDYVKVARPGDHEITILNSNSNRESGEALVNRAAAFLRCHGFTENVHTVVTDLPIAKELDRNYIESTDLVVAGVHSKKPFADFFVGSVTKALIGYGHTTLLLSQ